MYTQGRACSVMKINLSSIVLGALLAAFPATTAEEQKAKLLLKLEEIYDNRTTFFKLNQSVLEDISNLQRPIRVVATVGNARVGKSTTLNLISHTWEGKSEDDTFEETFETGDSFEVVTRDVWAHVIQPRSQEGSILLLDVQGTDQGDDRITEQLSIFTAMMSSELNIFTLNIVGNGASDFLYRISRLSDLIFKNKRSLQNFPSLRIVVRSNLTPPKDFKNHIRDVIFRPNSASQKKGDMIRRYFPKYSIAVCQIPSVNDTKILKNLTELRKSSYWSAFDELMTDLRKSPVKKTFEGNPVDGKALKDIAENLVAAMNLNKWTDFGDTYSTIERDICRRSYEKHVKPVLKGRVTVLEMKEKMMSCLNEFKEECLLEKERKVVEDELISKLVDTTREENAEKWSILWFIYENWISFVFVIATNILTYYFSWWLFRIVDIIQAQDPPLAGASKEDTTDHPCQKGGLDKTSQVSDGSGAGEGGLGETSRVSDGSGGLGRT